MSKKFSTTNTNLEVSTSRLDVVEIDDISFEKDERYPWVDVYVIGESCKRFIEKFDTEVDEDIDIVSYEDLKVFALNWFFKNVEVVKEID
ncbi:ubiquitin [Clostridium chrysemydis]|uniref:ubiquitin n=1 Tax=Clostridium chrysemydis TaxID=2665504 RepID=UPI0018837974|nr:ubiquitin [Clostridium chrysemydis]